MTGAAETVQCLDPNRAYTVLVCDLIGLLPGADGNPDCSEVRRHIENKGGLFHDGGLTAHANLEKGRVHFFYQPDLSTRDELIAAAGQGQYDAVIAAATFIPKETIFPLGGVRIGAGTGNMGSASWGGGGGEGGEAPLMNTPGINSRATAQMAMKAILKVLPDLDVGQLHARVTAGDFDTGKELRDYPTAKLEGKTIAIIGYGNIGRELAKLARAFGMTVVIHARARHREWIESEGFVYAATPLDAAKGADVLSVHVGLGNLDTGTGRYANGGLLDGTVLSALRDGAVLINYDRGELVDIAALDEALTSGKIRHAAIDADLFRNPDTGELSGPMKPYLRLVDRHADKLELLPHAAADTDHPSRVAGARQAVDQIMDVIRLRKVVNLKGTLPEGYQSGGTRTPPGVGPVTAHHLTALAADRAVMSELAALAEMQASVFRAFAESKEENLDLLVSEHAETLVRTINRSVLLAERLGLTGRYGN
jgi:lactate dehydrogenase-like 2-hydroxyacid dehydrogenase